MKIVDGVEIGNSAYPLAEIDNEGGGRRLALNAGAFDSEFTRTCASAHPCPYDNDGREVYVLV
jgi:hypothetical protein